MYQFLLRHSTKKSIYLGLIFILFINLIAFPLFPKLFFGSPIPVGEILDTQFGFSEEYVHNLLNTLESKGRKSYLLSTIFIDISYSLVYGFIYSFILIALLRKTNSHKYDVIIYIPFLISLFDCFENTGIILLILSFPDNCNLLVQLTSISNQLKWAFALITVLLFIILLLQKKVTKKK